jgi:hypothetical protein
MTPKLMNPDYCLAQAKEVDAWVEREKISRRESLLRVSRSYVHLAELAMTGQRKSTTSASAINPKSTNP